MTSTPHLEVATGSGLLARRPQAAMFLPTPDPAESADTEGLITSFLEAEPNGVLVAAETWLAAHGIDGRCFALVDWSTTIEVMVLGDLAVTTDLPTLPLLTGAGSSTWVEHRVRVRPDEITISVGDEPQTSGSHLDGGAVPAGGFRLKLQSATIETRHEPEPTAEARETGLAALRAAMDGATARLECEPSEPTVDTLPSVPTLVFDDDRRILLAGTVVVGRQPNAESARFSGEAVEINHGSSSTSRTHVVVDVSGPGTTVTDCGTDNGTAVVPYEGANPFRLQPWIPQELDSGAQVFLGGPTWFRLEASEGTHRV
ncbi:MAG: FHA domain-containing protein [Actinomycetia bacterium]|nr:FHA domain-containing protein [Actinomycetes bacterium]MCP3911548.1 FHA domain-containing protein [Actinomycetes bacterium]MCP4083825.1 FHA domain-containing protein [Actinomycetes bacterium]